MALRARFDWDAGNLAKCQKHGVTLDEIETLFDTDPFMSPDEAHSEAEDRFVAVGPNRTGRPILVVFTIRVVDGAEVVRPVSARYMHRKEIEKYEKSRRSEGAGDENGRGG